MCKVPPSSPFSSCGASSPAFLKKEVGVMAYERDLMEKIIGNIGEAASGLEYLYQLAEDRGPEALKSSDKIQFLHFILNALDKTVTALEDIVEGRDLERVEEVLGEVRW